MEKLSALFCFSRKFAFYPLLILTPVLLLAFVYSPSHSTRLSSRSTLLDSSPCKTNSSEVIVSLGTVVHDSSFCVVLCMSEGTASLYKCRLALWHLEDGAVSQNVSGFHKQLAALCANNTHSDLCRIPSVERKFNVRGKSHCFATVSSARPVRFHNSFFSCPFDIDRC